MISLAPPQFSSFISLSNNYFSLNSCTLQCSPKSNLKTLLCFHNLSFNGVLISINEGKTKMTLRLNLIVIQVTYGLFFNPSWLLLGQLGFLCPFTFMPNKILAKRKFNLVLTKVWTHNHANVKSMHTNSTNSCFVIILIILRLYYHSTWSNILLK